jgi:hypothetical protein
MITASRPRGAVRAGSESAEYSTRQGQPAAAIRCMGLVSLTQGQAGAGRQRRDLLQPGLAAEVAGLGASLGNPGERLRLDLGA